jgi:hypothetical protein
MHNAALGSWWRSEWDRLARTRRKAKFLNLRFNLNSEIELKIMGHFLLAD